MEALISAVGCLPKDDQVYASHILLDSHMASSFQLESIYLNTWYDM